MRHSKKFLGLMLCLLVLVSTLVWSGAALASSAGHSHPACGAACTHSGIHSNTNYQPWTDTAIQGGVLPEGNYYLTEDIEISQEVQIQGKVAICLNGYGIKSKFDSIDKTLFTVNGGAELVITNCNPQLQGRIEGQKPNGDNGRAIYCREGSKLEVYKIEFKSFDASNSGGIIYADNAFVHLDNVDLTSGYVKGGDSDYFGGGALYLNGIKTEAVIENCYFYDGYAYGRSNPKAHGGAIYVDQIESVVIRNNTFAYCTVSTTGDGGAIYCRIPKKAEITNNRLEYNSAKNGGAIALVMSTDSYVKLEDNIISSNTASIRGGGLTITNVGGTLDFVSGVISENTADWGGGIDYTTHGLSPLELKNVLITGNEAPRGGGIWACPTSETETYSTLGGTIYGNLSEGEFKLSGSPTKLQASGDEVRYEAADTDDTFTLTNNPSSSTSFMTVSQRALGGGLTRWYSDAPDSRYKEGDAEAAPTLYTNAKSSFGLHGELSPEHQAMAESMAKIIIRNNTADSRGGGIASNSPIIIGMRNADITVNVEKKWNLIAGAIPPAEVRIDLFRVDVAGKRVKLDSGVPLNAQNGWKASFTDLPALYDDNGVEKNFTYEITEHPIDGWKCEAVTTVQGNTHTIVLTNTPFGPQGADATVNVEKKWDAKAGAAHPTEVLIDLFRVDASGKRVRLDSGVPLNAQNGWKASFTNLPSRYVENGVEKNFTYEIAEYPIDGWKCEAVTTVQGNTHTIVLTNTKLGAAPQTGDSMNIALCVILACLSLFGLTFAVIHTKRCNS